jgi:hypothetical protein
VHWAARCIATTIATAVATSLATPLAAQDPPPRPLPAVTEEHPEGVSSITGLVELSGGSILVADAQEATLRILSFADGGVRLVDSRGGGPREYISVGGLYRQRNGEIWLLDVVQRRYLVLSAAGRPLRTVPWVLGSNGSFSFSSGRDPHLLDGRGVEYQRSLPVGAGATLDSASLMRRTATRTDTIAKLRNPTMSASSAMGASIVASQRFSASDGFAVAESGAVAIVRADPYRVEWLDASGRVRIGPTLSFTALPVTAADRDSAAGASRDAARSMNLPRITQRGADGVDRAVDVGALAPSVPVATTKPSIDPRRLMIDRAGRLWVGRHMPHGSPLVYDVFDASGARIDRVQLPAASALVGFGDGRIYVAREDADGLKFVGRIPYAPPR